MNELKQLKKKLKELKCFKKELPRLIDLSEIYGDDYYNENDLFDIDRQIEEIKEKITEIKKANLKV